VDQSLAVTPERQSHRWKYNSLVPWKYLPSKMFSILATILLVGALVGPSLSTPFFSHVRLGPLDLFPRTSTISSGCSTTGPASCHNTTAVSNLCCFEAPGGLLLQTQFWDTSPSTGPSNSWTIHGLWPDHCDLTFSSSCDPSRAYTGIDSLLTANGASATLSFMQTVNKSATILE
jgi:ribonuclease T2